MLDKLRLCYNPNFKEIFLNEKEVLMQMVYDITPFDEFMSFENVIKGYKLESYELDGEISKSNAIIEINNTYYLGIELNYKREKIFPYQISSPYFKICSTILDSGASDEELSRKKIVQLNPDTFSNDNGKVLQKGIYTDADTGKLINDMISFLNLDIVKCYEEAYDNIEMTIGYLRK